MDNSREIKTRPQPMAGQRRARPHTYTSQACERCRNRKQRCVIETEFGQTCRNCLDSGSVCVLSARPDKAKRVRSDPSTSCQPPDRSGPSSPSRSSVPPSQPVSPIPMLHSIPPPLIETSAPALTLLSHSATEASNSGPLTSVTPSGTHSNGTSTPSNLASLYASCVDPSKGTEFDWNSWSTALAAHGKGNEEEWQTFLSTFSAQNQSQRPFSPPSIPNIPPLATSVNKSSGPLQPLQPPQKALSTSPSNRRREEPTSGISPGIQSDEGSMFEAAKGLAMISLEAAAEPHYVGESSGTLWGTIIAKGMQSTHANSLESLLRPIPTSQTPGHPPLPIEMLRQSIQKPISEGVAAVVLETVFQHLHSRYPFMDWVTFDIQWRIRNALLVAVGQERPLDRDGGTAAFFVLMVLAIGSQLCKDMNLPGLLRPEEYYTLAMPYLNVIVQLHNLANLQGFLLMAMYSLRDSRGPSVWYISGVAIRLCIGLGLHRNLAGKAMRVLGKYEIEMRKRVFWTCYTLDRMVVLLLGRPPGISDDDIDVDLPDYFTPESQLSIPTMRTSSMSSSIHYIKLKRIESRIQRAVYTVSRPSSNTAEYDLCNLLKAIDEWENTIPPEASASGCWALPCCSRDWFYLRGVEARLQLIRPLCTSANDEIAKQTLLPLLAKNAARGCELQKKTHQLGQPGSSSSVRSTFICGLTLLYAVFLQPTVLPLKDVFSAIKAASNTLFAYSHRDRTSEVLYDVFEELSSVCVEQLSQGIHTDNNSNTISGTATTTTVEEWQKASAEATNNISPNTAGEYVEIMRSIGLPLGDERNAYSTAPESLWDLAAFFPGNISTTSSTTYNGIASNVNTINTMTNLLPP